MVDVFFLQILPAEPYDPPRNQNGELIEEETNWYDPCDCELCDPQIEEPEIEDYEAAWNDTLENRYSAGLKNLYEESGVIWSDLTEWNLYDGFPLKSTQVLVDLAIGYGFDTPGAFLDYLLESQVIL